jgi:hypothetical protein
VKTPLSPRQICNVQVPETCSNRVSLTTSGRSGWIYSRGVFELFVVEAARDRLGCMISRPKGDRCNNRSKGVNILLTSKRQANSLHLPLSKYLNNCNMIGLSQGLSGGNFFPVFTICSKYLNNIFPSHYSAPQLPTPQKTEKGKGIFAVAKIETGSHHLIGNKHPSESCIRHFSDKKQIDNRDAIIHPRRNGFPAHFPSLPSKRHERHRRPNQGTSRRERSHAT